MSPPRIQHREPSAIHPRLLLRSGQIAPDSYCIAYEYEGEPPAECIGPTAAEAWDLMRLVIAAHERIAA